MDAFSYPQKKIEALFVELYNGDINPRHLPKDLYASIADYVMGGVHKGIGGEIEFGNIDIQLAENLSDNVYLFSGAKTFQQTLEMSGQLIDENGGIRTFNEFKIKANEVFTRYNGGTIDSVAKPGWLEAEYNTAMGQAQNAKKWSIIENQQDLFPFLRYNALGNSCPICKPFDGVHLPVNHPFWRKYMPLNHFNCNCIVEQYEEGEKRTTSEKKVEKIMTINKVPDDFKFNAGIKQELFSTEGKTKHPYFIVPKEYTKFAQTNFNLSIP